MVLEKCCCSVPRNWWMAWFPSSLIETSFPLVYPKQWATDVLCTQCTSYLLPLLTTLVEFRELSEGNSIQNVTFPSSVVAIEANMGLISSPDILSEWWTVNALLDKSRLFSTNPTLG